MTVAGSTTDIAGQRSGGAAKRILITLPVPILIFCLARAMILFIAADNGLDPLDVSQLARWDANHYLDIAEHGYSLYLGPSFNGSGKIVWNGNAGWMPGYPMVIRAVSFFGVPPLDAGAIVSAVFELATLIVVWAVFFEARWSWPNVVSLGVVAFFPGMIYRHAIFPISQLNLLTILCLYFVWRQKWIWAGVLGALAAFTYTTGFVLAAALLGWAIVGMQSIPWRKRLQNGAIGAAMTLAGLGGVMMMQRISVGYWDAFYKIDGN
jgi:Gpi18-like mannosyltransferase